jgi:hypothetical protein
VVRRAVAEGAAGDGAAGDNSDDASGKQKFY